MAAQDEEDAAEIQKLAERILRLKKRQAEVVAAGNVYQSIADPEVSVQMGALALKNSFGDPITAAWTRIKFLAARN